LVYPVARALPVLLLGLVDVARSRPPSAAGWAGMSLIAGGCLLAPHKRLSELRLSHYRRQTTVWVLLVATGTVGYTLLDKLAAETIAPGPGAAARYGYAFFVSSFVVYTVLAKSFRLGSQESTVPRPGWVLGGAFCNFGSYWLILWVYQLVERASYTVALRQFSIVIGVLAAVALFREPGARLRITAACLITAGLVVVSLAG